MPAMISDAHRITERLSELTEELLDAHCDTVCLAEALPAGPAWAAHLAYLRDLQRVGQRTLAELSPPDRPEPPTQTAILSRRSRSSGRVLARLRLSVGHLRGY